MAGKQIIIDGTRGSGTKNRTGRVVPLLPRAAQFLAQHPRQIRSAYVFCHTNGERYIQMERGFKAACRRADIVNLRWHDLRRTCGSRLLQDHGFSMEEVKEWL
ncbi:MAG: tyrosine-type recombinase/integrase, partial [Methyloligellaceae bacterium]